MSWPRRPSVVVVSTPPMHGWLSGPRIDLLFIVALLPPLGQALANGSGWLRVLILSLAVALGWQMAFAISRKRSLGFASIVPAIAFALLLPVDAPLWQAGLGLTFGVVVGVQLFGGYGWNFLNPVTVALSFLIFSFPEAGYGNAPPVPWEACIPGAVILVLTGVISWRIVLASSGALIAAMHLLPGPDLDLFATLSGFAFVLIFLACDPVAAPATNSGRWCYGILIGVLVSLGLASGKPQTEVFISAVLLGGIFSPLIDYAAARVQMWHRRRSYPARHE